VATTSPPKQPAELRAPSPAPSRMSQIRPGILTMVFFLGSEVMLFASFFAAYFFIRFNIATEWPPLKSDGSEHIHFPLLITGINTLILVSSSFTIHWGEHRFKHYGDRKGLERGLLVTMFLGATFLVIQLNEYAHLNFNPQDVAAAGAFFSLTGLHGMHVLLGLTILFFCYVRVRVGDFTPEWFTPLQAGAIYWHFVDVVWVILYLLVYVM